MVLVSRTFSLCCRTLAFLKNAGGARKPTAHQVRVNRDAARLWEFKRAKSMGGGAKVLVGTTRLNKQ